MNPLECSICAENYNLSTRKRISCDYCQFEACRKCCETYILNNNESKCMNTQCGKIWTRKFLRTNFTLKFINTDLKKKKEQILFEREQSMLPATQIIIEEEMVGKKIEKEILALRKQVAELQRIISDKQNELYFHNNGTNKTQEKKAFIKKCPNGDCRGFLSTQWKCGLCEYWSCPECHEVKGDKHDSPHTCNPDNVASAKLIAKDSRACPGCSSLIYKIDGCDQMFCTGCKTVFSWITGKIEKGNVHNPHYFEWLRLRGEEIRNPMDINGCNGGNDINILEHHIIDEHYIAGYRFDSLINNVLIKTEKELRLQDKKINEEKYKKIRDKLWSVVRNIREIAIYILPRYRPDVLNNNLDLRKQFLLNEIDQEKFKALIQRSDKQYEKKTEMYNIFNMMVTAGSDILYRFITAAQEKETRSMKKMYNNYLEIFPILNEFDELIVYANECIEDINHVFTSNSNGHFNLNGKWATSNDDEKNMYTFLSLNNDVWWLDNNLVNINK